MSSLHPLPVRPPLRFPLLCCLLSTTCFLLLPRPPPVLPDSFFHPRDNDDHRETLLCLCFCLFWLAWFRPNSILLKTKRLKCNPCMPGDIASVPPGKPITESLSSIFSLFSSLALSLVPHPGVWHLYSCNLGQTIVTPPSASCLVAALQDRCKKITVGRGGAFEPLVEIRNG